MRHQPHFSDSKPSALSPSDFRFSFTSKESLATSSPRSNNINIRRYRGGGGKITTPNVFYSTTYDDDCDEDVDDDDDEQNEYESDDGQTSAQHSRHSGSMMIPTNSDISKLPQHLQHRKILPLPKPRWKRKGLQKATSNDNDQQQSANNNTTTTSSSPPLTPYIWRFSPPAREIQQRYSEHEDWGMSRLSLADDPNCLFQEVFTGDDSSYRDNAKKMKRSTGSESTSLPSAEYDERKSTLRRKDRKWRNSSSSHSNNIATDGSRITPGIQLPESAFDFAMDKRTRDQLKGLPTLDDLPRPKSVSLGLSNVLRQAMTPVAPSISPPLPPSAPPSASSTTKSIIASPSSPPPAPHSSSTLTQSLPTVTARAKRNESIPTTATTKVSSSHCPFFYLLACVWLTNMIEKRKSK